MTHDEARLSARQQVMQAYERHSEYPYNDTAVCAAACAALRIAKAQVQGIRNQLSPDVHYSVGWQSSNAVCVYYLDALLADLSDGPPP